MRWVRCEKVGFVSTFEIDGEIKFEHGQWTGPDSERSSNWRELRNLKQVAERVVKAEDYRGIKVSNFTDNTTTKSAFWTGMSKPSLLSEFVLELHEPEMSHDLTLYVIPTWVGNG
jgi:hypothetical protein